MVLVVVLVAFGVPVASVAGASVAPVAPVASDAPIAPVAPVAPADPADPFVVPKIRLEWPSFLPRLCLHSCQLLREFLCLILVAIVCHCTNKSSKHEHVGEAI